MIAIESHVSAMTLRSWEIKIIERSSSRLSRSRSSRICAWIMTSSAVTGSSAITIRGLHARAIAIITRCRMPPENSCGYSRARSRWIPTSSRSSPTRFIAASLSTLSWMTIGSAIWSPIRFTGFSAFIAPWKMIEMCFHRIPRSWPSETFARSYPTYSIVPSTIFPFDGRRRMIDRAAVVLPQPLSPASPRLSPSPKVKSTPSTARTVPSCVWKCVLRPFTVRSGILPLRAMGRTSSGTRFSERGSRTPGSALTFSQTRTGSSASYKGNGAFAVDEARGLHRVADARPSLLRVPDRLVVRDLDPVLGSVDPRPPVVRFRLHPRRRRLLDRAPRVPAPGRRRGGPHAQETDNRPERVVPLRGNPRLRPQRDVLGIRRRKCRVVARRGVLDRDLRVPVRGVARGGPRDGIPAVHRPGHDDPAPLERGRGLRRRRVRRGGGGPATHALGRRHPESRRGRRRGHVPRAEGRTHARVDVRGATRTRLAGRASTGGRRPVDRSRGVPRRHALCDGRVPAALPPSAGPLRIRDRDFDQRLPPRRGDLVRVCGDDHAGPRRIRDARPPGPHGVRRVFRHVWRGTVSRRGPAPGAPVHCLEPPARPHDRVPEPPARARPTGDRVVDGRVRLHLGPRGRRAARGGAHDNDRAVEHRPLPRGCDVLPVRLHPRTLAHDRRRMARGDSVAVPADRRPPHLAVPPPLGADESAQAVTAGTASAGGVTRWHATAFPGPSSMSGGSAQD